MNARIRQAERRDMGACADILNDWIDGRDWMPRVHTMEEVRDFYSGWMWENRDIYVAGDPPVGFMATDRHEEFVTALYVATPGEGLGKRFIDLAKAGRDELRVWTFQANTRAQDFYRREGFVEERRTDGDNEERLPDILFRWEAAA